MMKKAYMAPATDVVEIMGQSLMLIVSGGEDNVIGDGGDDTEGLDPQSRRHSNLWDED